MSFSLMQQLVQDRTSAYQAQADKARRWSFRRRATAAPAAAPGSTPRPVAARLAPLTVRTTGAPCERAAA
jgi:hypothetical protein